jgi:hypothetical protein
MRISFMQLAIAVATAEGGRWERWWLWWVCHVAGDSSTVVKRLQVLFTPSPQKSTIATTTLALYE